MGSVAEKIELYGVLVAGEQLARAAHDYIMDTEDNERWLRLSRSIDRFRQLARRYPATYQPAEHARALDALAVAVENVDASELGGGA